MTHPKLSSRSSRISGIKSTSCPTQTARITRPLRVCLTRRFTSRAYTHIQSWKLIAFRFNTIWLSCQTVSKSSNQICLSFTFRLDRWNKRTLRASSFYKYHRTFLDELPFKRGGWWKPYIIWRRLMEVPEGDIVVFRMGGSCAAVCFHTNLNISRIIRWRSKSETFINRHALRINFVLRYTTTPPSTLRRASISRGWRCCSGLSVPPAAQTSWWVSGWWTRYIGSCPKSVFTTRCSPGPPTQSSFIQRFSARWTCAASTTRTAGGGLGECCWIGFWKRCVWIDFSLLRHSPIIPQFPNHSCSIWNCLSTGLSVCSPPEHLHVLAEIQAFPGPGPKMARPHHQTVGRAVVSSVRPVTAAAAIAQCLCWQPVEGGVWWDAGGAAPGGDHDSGDVQQAQQSEGYDEIWREQSQIRSYVLIKHWSFVAHKSQNV